jgi:uncharacterized coiled-coil DUF342 family protein
MSDDTKDLNLVFAPGCFDDFDGTQEELDALVQEIYDTFNKGDWMQEAETLDPEEDRELVNYIESVKVESIKPKRTYH